MVDLLIEETRNINEMKGKGFDIPKSIMAQLPFFSCKNIVLNEKAQKDIARYIYCSDFGISPYQGSYGNQPARWIEKSFLLKKIMNNQKTEGNG